jgi:hypothetical protein
LETQSAGYVVSYNCEDTAERELSVGFSLCYSLPFFGIARSAKRATGNFVLLIALAPGWIFEA